MGNSASSLNDNNVNNVGNTDNTIYDTRTTINILKTMFENENYCFSSFSSKNHGEIVKKTIKNSQEQEQIKTIELNGDPILNEFVNNFYRTFSNFSSSNDINKTTNDGMIKYEIYSVQSLNSTTTNNQSKFIWLPKSITIVQAHRILSTILYSNNIDIIPVDLADYVLVYENIMIPLENQNKELYEEILKISFRLNRIGLPSFRLLIIHKSLLLLLERKESNSLLIDNESISILQLIIFHLIPNNQNEYSSQASSACNKDQKTEYWPINEIKMGVMPSSKLIHPLKHNKLCQIISNIIQSKNLSIGIKMTFDACIQLLEEIFNSVNADISYIKLISSSLSKSVQIYDYPLLIALPYNRLLLSQFCKTQSSDGRWAQGIMTNGKYYSLFKNSYTPMSELKINPGSIIQLKFNIQSDTIVNKNISSSPINKVKVSKCGKEMSAVNKDKFPSTKYCYLAEFDNNTVRLMFPSEAIHSITSNTNTNIANNRTIISYLKSKFQYSNNWIDSRNKTYQTELINKLSTSSLSLINKPSTSSLSLIDKPECLNCLSPLNDDNLECPYCTQVFCQICIESSCDNSTNDHYCPTCNNKVLLLQYRKSAIIGKFDKEGISALKCLKCNSIPEKHKLCLNPKCSALFCFKCWKKEIINQTSTNVEKLDSTENIKCLQCKNADMYESKAVMYYSRRIIEYQTVQKIESNSGSSTTSSLLPNTIWIEEDWLPEKGTLEENYNRIISLECHLVQFNGDHIQFDNKVEYRPLLIIDEPSEYTCPESLQLSYWNTNNEINQWENDQNVQFHKYTENSIAAYIPPFTGFTVCNHRFTEHIMLDEAFLDVTYDYDFRKKIDTGKTFQRGPEPYTRPCGWYRKAIRALGRYENNIWLGTDANAWPVAYHGTSTANALPILRNGLLAGGSNGIRIVNGAAHGPGIYLSPNPLYSGSQYYSKPTKFKDRQYKIMFQVRVNNSSIRKRNENIWICNNSADVRPYEILFKET